MFGSLSRIHVLAVVVALFCAACGDNITNPGTAKELTAFAFEAAHNPGLAADVPATISGKTIRATVPHGTGVTGLVATFATTGVTVSVGGTAQVSGSTANDFTNPATYTVTATDRSTAAYSVIITVAPTSAKELTSYAFLDANNAALSADVAATINGVSIAATVPFGTDVTALVASFETTGASVAVAATAQVSGTTPNDFTSPVIYTVTAGDGTTKDYTVTVTIAPSNAKSITSYTFRATDNSGLSADVPATITGTTIAATVPFGTVVTALVATFSTTGTSVAVGGTTQVSSTTPNDFTGPVTYVVTAADATTRSYTVTVTVAPSSAKDLTAFEFKSSENGGLSADVIASISGTNITATVPFGTNVTALVASFQTTGASVKVSSVVQTTDVTANDFSSSVTYTVTAVDATTKAYAVTVTIALNPAKDITAFEFKSSENAGLPADVVATITGTSITATVPFGTVVTALIASFQTTGASVAVKMITQTSDQTANDFTFPAGYVVTAADGTTQTYIVTITIAGSPAKDITAFQFRTVDNAGLALDAIGTITGTNIDVAVMDSNVTALVATFSTTGASVTVGAAVQTSSVSANDFTLPVIYRVIAADSTTKDYTVTVTQTALRRSSHSSAIAISDDDRVVAAVSPDDDKVYLINTATNVATVVAMSAGCEPRSVAYAPDYSFWVACRNAGTLARITGIDGAPVVGGPIAVGSEPTAVAVAPHGTKVVVANYVDDTLTIVPVTGSAVTVVMPAGANPRALAITNGGGSDNSETIYATLMFGKPVGGVQSEGNDIGRQGVVIPVTIGTGVIGEQIELATIADTTFKVPDKAAPIPNQITVGAYPNQLQSIVLHGGKAYVPSTAASPAGPLNNAGNVHPFVSVFDTTTNLEKPFGASGALPGTSCGTSVAAGTAGYAAGTLDLAVQVRDLNGATVPAPVLFPTLPVDMDFVPGNTSIGYVVSMASDEVLRVAWDFVNNVACVGSPSAQKISLGVALGDIKVPIGIVVSNSGTAAYVNSWAGREVEVLDLTAQAVSTRIPLSAADTDAIRAKGKKFFWTSTARWSKTGWGSCGACHPDGLSDNVTFVFGTGPRQTIPLDSTYSKIDPTDQRILNWTAINDEIHDFENNTRNVSGGLGAVVSTTSVQIDLKASGDFQNSGSVKQLSLDGTTSYPLVGGGTGTVNTATAAAWDAIDHYIQTLRSQHHPSGLSPTDAAVMAGTTLFQAGNCAKCHAGPKWTISTRPYTPAQGSAAGSPTCSMQTTPLALKSVPGAQNTDVFQLELERAPTGQSCVTVVDCGTTPGYACTGSPGYCTVPQQRLACALRKVGTFGAKLGTAFEVRSDTSAVGIPQVGEGLAGFNIPSLLSLSATAPYLHNGGAADLVSLLRDATFMTHLTSGNPIFTVDATQAAQLAAFLLSIDASTTAPTIDSTLDLCTGSFTPNVNACTAP